MTDVENGDNHNHDHHQHFREVEFVDDTRHVRAISELSSAFSTVSFDDDVTMNVSKSPRMPHKQQKQATFPHHQIAEETKEEIEEWNEETNPKPRILSYTRNNNNTNTAMPSPTRSRFTNSGDHTVSSVDVWSIPDAAYDDDSQNVVGVQVGDPVLSSAAFPMSPISTRSAESDPGRPFSPTTNTTNTTTKHTPHWHLESNGVPADHHGNPSIKPSKRRTFREAMNEKLEEPSSIYAKVWRCLRCRQLPLPLVASWIVRHAPCFWCCFWMKQIPQSSTDRIILIRLNYLCAIFSIVQIGVGMFVAIVLFDAKVAYRGDDDYYHEALIPNLWTLSGMLLLLAFLGFVILIVMISSRSAIRHVNLQGSIRYMWVLYWIVPLEILFVISLFDYHEVTEIWVRHYWSTPSMAWFREVFCVPYETAHNQCKVPYSGGKDFRNGTDWCLQFHNATNCESIRDTAENKMNTISYTFFTMNAVWGACQVVLLIITLAMLQGIISTPIVQKSKEANIPTWLTFPMILSFSGGCVFLFSPSSFLSDESGSRFQWIGISYMMAAGTFFLTALLGWYLSAKTVLNTHDMIIKRIGVNLFIFFLFLATIAVGAIFTASIIYSLNFVAVSLDDRQRGSIACVVDSSGGCSNCPSSNLTIYNSTQALCPEWSQQDVVRVMQSQLKQSASLGAMFLIYALSALRFAFALRSHIHAYQIEYI